MSPHSCCSLVALHVTSFVLACSYEWVDDDTIGALVIPAERGALPERPPVPIGPNIQDNSSGKTSQVPRHCSAASQNQQMESPGMLAFVELRNAEMLRASGADVPGPAEVAL